ncbi:hypothetical protein J437_LFUL011841 [Ladona fulva]|uniref:DNA-directed DNA polymerase n=1 Tax=Ladona fulva TaxID=123851 RepID=A0A8K0P094_LADFU|nr:hypothetical protein J437_LFUL011841 [Ladona fulva]
MNGTKILSISYDGLRFVDSLNFLPMALSKLPSALGLGESLGKGYFPHFFNRRENADYRGPLPPAEMYGIDSMSSKEREDFLTWHGEMSKTHIFDMKAEIRKYCGQDVRILSSACLRFREIFLASTGVDPFREAVAVASACMRVFRMRFLKPDVIAIIPPGGYRLADRQSRKALSWLLWEEKQRDICIQHAANGREARVMGKKVDGLWENTVFEFHGCVACFPNRTHRIMNSPKETMATRFEATVRKTEDLRNAGFEVVEKWECEFDREIRVNDELSAFLSNNPFPTEPPINPRDAFYGGRTNCVRLHHKADVASGETIRYLDVCSLYPFVNKYRKYPVGHPQIFLGEDCPELDEVEGIVRCFVIPPTSLYHPLLPLRLKGKLVFPLCRSCAEEERQDDCDHVDAEAITGTWVSDEVKVAVREGYRVSRIHEVWQYRTTVYNAATG